MIQLLTPVGFPDVTLGCRAAWDHFLLTHIIHDFLRARKRIGLCLFHVAARIVRHLQSALGLLGDSWWQNGRGHFRLKYSLLTMTR